MIGWHWSWWGWTLMTVAMLAFWGALFWLLSGLGQHAGDPEAGEPERVLADRLARGDIDVDEYRRRVGALHDDAEEGVR